MIRIVALNEEKASDDDEDGEVQVTKEAEETIAISEYMRALQLKQRGYKAEALSLFAELLEAKVVYEVSLEDKQNKLFSVKYNCHKNIALMYEEKGYKQLSLEHFVQGTKSNLLQKQRKRRFSWRFIAIRSIDHLNDLLSVLGSGSKLENIRLHRTKCSNLIKHVISSTLLTKLIESVGDATYSIIIDESTDVSVIKHLCMYIRYFDVAENRIITTFLGILDVERATSDAPFKSIIEYFEKIGLPLKNLTAVGTDGGSNLCGCNHSVFTLLKEKVPNLQLVKCACHSLHLCASKASEELSSSLDFLAREIFKWFSVSSLRRINYRKTFDLINMGTSDGQKFMQMVKLSRTRRLTHYNVVKRLLTQWVELKTHFQIACDAERCYTARIVRDMLEDDTNRMYLLFIRHILREIQHLNISFQEEMVDVGSLYEEMSLIFFSLAKRILKLVFLKRAMRSADPSLMRQVRDALENDLAFLPVTEIDCGVEFKKSLLESTISAQGKAEIMRRCCNFLRRLLREIGQRLPNNLDMFRSYKLLNPSVCLSEEVRTEFNDLPIKQFCHPNSDTALYKSQWDKLRFVDWKAQFGGEIPSNIILVWPGVYKYADASGRPAFQELAKLVLKMLVIPTSSAVVERAFSALTLIKTRIRNKLRTPMLQALLRIRLHFQAFGKCRKTFDPPREMIDRFKSSYIYASSASETATSANASIEENENSDNDNWSEMLDIISGIV